MQNLDQVIRERAYHLWIADGQPEGQSDQFWIAAQREILMASMLEMPSASAATDRKPASKVRQVSPKKSKRRAA